MGKHTLKSVIFLVVFLVLLIVSCSTSPKNRSDVFDMRKQAEVHLDLGNKLSDRGDNGGAVLQLNEAQRLGIAADDSSLIIRTSLSMGNVLANLGRMEEASAELETALAESLLTENRELTAISRIHISRYTLLAGSAPAQKVKEDIAGEIGFIKSDDLYIAFAWTASGLAEKELGNFNEAETAVKKALAIHEKGRYLEQAAYDWFLIGSIRSLSRNYSGAQDALKQAVAMDRRIENSYGLATDWRALGDIYARAGNAADSRAAYRRSAKIFRALGNEEAATEAESRIK